MQQMGNQCITYVGDIESERTSQLSNLVLTIVDPIDVSCLHWTRAQQI